LDTQSFRFIGAEDFSRSESSRCQGIWPDITAGAGGCFYPVSCYHFVCYCREPGVASERGFFFLVTGVVAGFKFALISVIRVKPALYLTIKWNGLQWGPYQIKLP